MTEIQLDVSAWGGWIVAGAAILIAAAVWLYRETIPTTSGRVRALLTFLRGTSLALIFFLIFEPYLQLRFDRTEPAVIGVLIDESESMALADSGIERYRTVRSILDQKRFRELQSRADVRFFGFSGTVDPVEPERFDSIKFDGALTDLSGAIRDVRQQLAGENLKGLLIFSDGQYNFGSNPVEALPDVRVPVFAVGIGDTSERRDIVLREVATNEITYRDEKVPVDVLISGHGYDGRVVSVQLWLGDRMIDSRNVTIEGDGSSQRLRFDFTPTEAGQQKISVRIVPLQGELTERNNAKSVIVRVLKNRFQVVLLSGAPGPDHAILLKTLAEDPNVTVWPYVERRDGSIIEIGKPWGEISWKDVDAVVLNDYPTGASGGTRWETVLREKKPVFYFYGPNVDAAKLKRLEDRMPIDWVRDAALGENTVFPSVTLTGKTSAILKVLDDPDLTIAQWSDVPPLWLSGMTARPRDGADVLVRVDMTRASNLIRLRRDVPLILSGRQNNVKSIAVVPYGLWKAHLVMAGLRRDNRVYVSFVQNGIRWLTVQDDSRRVIVSTSRLVFQNGEPVLFNGQMYDEQLKPLPGADVRVRIRSSAVDQEMQLQEAGNGRYEGTLPRLPAGDYRFDAEATKDGVVLGRDGGRFVVEPYSIELIHTRLREDVLRALAVESGGRYARAERWDEVIAAIPTESRTGTASHELALWNWPLLMFVVTGLLSLEWLIRKRKDML